MVGLVPHAIEITFVDQIGFENVVLAPDNFGSALALFNCEDGGQRLVFDRYRFNGLGENMAVGMSQQQDGFLGMVHEFIRQAWLIVPDQRDAILPRNIFRGNDHEFIPGNSRSERDLSDPAAGNLAANGCSEQHIWQNHIIDVLRSSGYLVASLFARNRLANDPIAAHFDSLDP